jgi:hypothetical protein
MSFQKDGVHTWVCQPSASSHAQLDTATVIRDAAQLQGNWRIVTSRLITHIDSVTFADKRIYRSATQRPKTSSGAMLVTDRKISVTETNPALRNSGKTINSNYELVNQRYLLLYRGAKSGGAVSQVGLDAQGRLVMHTAAVTERKIPGRYQVYQTVISQTILERQ